MERVTREDLWHHRRVTVRAPSAKKGTGGTTTESYSPPPSRTRSFHWPNLTRPESKGLLMLAIGVTCGGWGGQAAEEGRGSGDKQEASYTGC